ncbi:stage II sporulation protein M [Clostridium thermobutyricum]|uniref:Stage II sporulation protein M n=2 Tax=Clostridium thermobutyricum TaxID=29372 RepID=N9Y1I4_9CLOT|nr:stage II sporulation protein M [Clostridium thermobutyricum]ENZ02014.1 stage II sporulation protein M [Clostridium thermobutyricum]OPX46886.1 stage II sporulation protein M [Clostridium thermobutyricum DSM 4928]
MKLLAKKIGDTFEEQKFYYLIVLLFFCIGVVIGVYAVKYMSLTDRQDLTSYYSSFIENIQTNEISYANLLFEIFKKNIIIIIPIIILGFTFFGSPIILIINLMKGFSIGYTFTFLLTMFNGDGLMLAVSSLVPQNIIYIPCIVATSIIALSLSTLKFKEKFIKKMPIKNLLLNKGGTNILLIILCIFIIGMIIEAYLSPNLIKLVVTKFYL